MGDVYLTYGHLQYLDSLKVELQQLREAGLKLGPSKWHIFQYDLQYFSHAGQLQVPPWTWSKSGLAFSRNKYIVSGGLPVSMSNLLGGLPKLLRH